MTFAAGQTVRCIRNNGGAEHALTVGKEYVIDRVRESEVTLVGGDDVGNTWGWLSSRFEAVGAPACVPAKGVQARVTAETSMHHFDIGSLITLVSETEPDYWLAGAGVAPVTGEEEWGSSTGRRFRNISISEFEVIGSAPAKEQTLQEYKVEFMVKADQRGRTNGPVYHAQVVEALDALARAEYMEPTTTKEAFQARIVSIAMDAKVKHGWCEEPEKFLRENGLEHLLSVTKSVTMTVDILVTLPPGASDRDFRIAAGRLVAGIPNAVSRRIRVL